MTPHLLVDVTAHGYGHASMTAPVLDVLCQLVPELRITLRSGVAESFLRSRIRCDFSYIHHRMDFGMHMHNAVDVDIEKSAAAYQEFHRDWSGRVQAEAALVRRLKPDLLLANVPYLALAAANRAGIPSVGMCCLNWADLYRHYFLGDRASDAIHGQILAAYNAADVFLKVQPGMPMPEFASACEVGVIARHSQNRRDAILSRFPGAERLVLVAMGGMEFRLPVESWPQIPGVHWLLPADWQVQRADMSAFDAFGFPFSEVLASCDAVLTKPGYGTFTEAVCNGTPVLYVSRGDWPEARHLVNWLHRHGNAIEVERDDLMRGELQTLLTQLWAMPAKSTLEPTGAHEVAELLAARLR